MIRDEYIAELRRRADVAHEAGTRRVDVYSLGRAGGLREAATLAESVDVPTWRDVTESEPAVGAVMLARWGDLPPAVTCRLPGGSWWRATWNSPIAPDRWAPIPADEVTRG